MSSYDKIIEIFQERLDIADPSSIKQESTFKELDIDSLDLLEVITEIELHFGISIPDEEFGNFENVGQAIQYIVGLVEQG